MLERVAGLAKTKQGVAIGKTATSMGLIFFLLASSVGAIYVASRPEISGWVALLSFIGITAFGVILGQACYDIEGWLDQRRRDMVAARIWDALSQGDKPQDFVLYLRPFISTNQITETKHEIVMVRATQGAPTFFAPVADRMEFEEEIEQAMRPIGPLVALGRPLEHMGAGRIRVSDDIWQEAIGKLMDEAALIVLLPSPRPGTSWEVERVLSSGALARTILIDPPNEKGSDDSEYDPVKEWAGVRSSFEAHGYKLPHDDADGLLIHFGEAKEPQRIERISLVDGEGHIRAFAKKILKLQRADMKAQHAEGTSHA